MQGTNHQHPGFQDLKSSPVLFSCLAEPALELYDLRLDQARHEHDVGFCGLEEEQGGGTEGFLKDFAADAVIGTLGGKVTEPVDERVDQEACGDGIPPGRPFCADALCRKMGCDHEEVVEDWEKQRLLRTGFAPRPRSSGSIVEGREDGSIVGQIARCGSISNGGEETAGTDSCQGSLEVNTGRDIAVRANYQHIKIVPMHG
jgi:hypothetical protein